MNLTNDLTQGERQALCAAQAHRGHKVRGLIVIPDKDPIPGDEPVTIAWACSCGSACISRAGKFVNGDRDLGWVLLSDGRTE